MNTKAVMVGIVGMSLLAAMPVRAERMAGMSDKDCSTHCDLRELQKKVDALKSADKTIDASGDKLATKAAKKAQIQKDIEIDQAKLDEIKAEMSKY